MKRLRVSLFVVPLLVALVVGCAPAAPPTPTPAPAPAKPAAPAPAAPAPTQPAAKPAATQPAAKPAATQPAAKPAEKPAAEGQLTGTLTIAKAIEPVSADPAQHDGWYSVRAQSPSYEGLVAIRQEGGRFKVEPLLAESWEVSADGLTYTFKLRKNVKFHDGAPFDASAVKTSFERLRDVKGRPAWSVDPIKQIDVVDPSTVKITLKDPHTPFLLGMSRAYIVSPKALKERVDGGDLAKKWLNENAAGTGPYKLDGWQRNAALTYSRFNDYWRGWKGKHFDKIVLRHVPETATQRLLIERGEVDVADTVAVDDLDALARNANVAVQNNPAPSPFLMRMRVTRGPLENVKVRQALAFAFDYDAMVTKVMRGTASRTLAPIPKGQPGYTEEGLVQYKYDMARAKQLLTEAGHPNGGFSLIYHYINSVPYEKDAGLLLQASLKQLGIDFKLQEHSSAAVYTQAVYDRNSALDLYGWVNAPYIPDGDKWIRQMYHSAFHGSLNGGLYKNAQVDDLVTRALRVPAGADRDKLYGDAMRIINNEAPDIFVMTANDVKVFRKNIKGWAYNPFDALVEYGYYEMYRE